MMSAELISQIANLPPESRDEILGKLKESFGEEVVEKWILEICGTTPQAPTATDFKPIWRNSVRKLVDHLYEYEERYIQNHLDEEKSQVRLRYIRIREKLMNPHPKTVFEFVERVSNIDELHHDEKFALCCRHKPPTIDEFCELDYWMGTQTNNGKNIYPGWRKLLREMFPDEYSTRYEILILSGCIGAGKSTVARIIMTYCIARLMCMAEAKQFYHHVPTTKYNFFCWAPTMGTAGAVLTGEMEGMMGSSKFFQHMRAMHGGFYPYDISMSAGSRASHNVGRALPMAIMSEVNFAVLNGQSKSNFDLIYRRMQSRFMMKGHQPFPIIIDSSIATDNDFTAILKKDYQAKLDSGKMKVVEWPIWEIKPRTNYSMETFEVFCGTSKIDPVILDKVSPEDRAMLKDNPETAAKIINVPIDFRNEFESDITTSIRDVAGVATSANSSFLPSAQQLSDSMVDSTPVVQSMLRLGIKKEHDHIQIIENLSDSYKKKFGNSDVLDEWDHEDTFVEAQHQELVRRGVDIDPIQVDLFDRRPRAIHLDLGFVKDKTGMACSVIDSFNQVERRDLRTGNVVMTSEPVINTEWCMYLGAQPSDEVPIYKIKEFLVDLRNLGMNIARVTMDGHQSRNLKQDLLRLDFDCEIVSVDRDKDAYLLWRRAMMEGRWFSPENSILEEEFRRLIDTGKKIDHPTDGSKDGADAVAGSVAGLYHMLNEGEEVTDNSQSEEDALDALIGEDSVNFSDMFGNQYENTDIDNLVSMFMRS